MSLLNVASPASEPLRVKNVRSLPPSVPLKIISLSFAAASIVMFPLDVVSNTAASPIERSSAASELADAPAAQEMSVPSLVST